MKLSSQPPRLVVKTLGVTFVTTALLLAVTFVVVIVSVGDQVRAGVAANLEASQRMFAAIESRERRERQAQAATVAENPTLKAAIDTYAADSSGLARPTSIRFHGFTNCPSVTVTPNSSSMCSGESFHG